MYKKINILGTDYNIEIHKMSEDEALKKNSWAGYCSRDLKLIVVADFDEKEFFNFESDKEKDITLKDILRHEIIHAFLNESGLCDNAYRPTGSWANNEEMVDWIAIQSPKIFSVFNTLGII
jgi:hypothetical protein